MTGHLWRSFAVVFGLVLTALVFSGGAAAANPNLGPNVIVFDPSMSTSQIQATVDAIATQQIPNQFGTQRYALLFKPGTYGSSAQPLNFQVGYYTEVAGLGRNPDDTVINGSVYVRNQCDSGGCVALNNFWRSLSNLRINVTTPNFGCYSGEFWPVSQAAPMRRVDINGNTTFMDYCTGPSFASGGFVADSRFSANIVNGSQQQWFTRNSSLNGWSNGVWNQVFSGVVGAPAECFPCGNPYTTLPTSPVTREAPYLYSDASGNESVFAPSVQTNTSGTSWASGPTPGTSVPIDQFYVAQPSDTAATINAALRKGKNLLLTPGVYHLESSINVTRPDTIVLGLGFPTLIPTTGDAALTTNGGNGTLISGIIVDAGPVNSGALMRIENGSGRGQGDPSDPSVLSDVFFRIGGAEPGRATRSLVAVSIEI